MAAGHLRGGYDYDFISPPPKSLECPICFLPLRQPMVVSCCGNHYCQSCISGIRRETQRCPLCNEAKFTTFLHKGVRREVGSLLIRCTKKAESGCLWTGELYQLEAHLEEGCKVECSYKCGESYPSYTIQEHEKEHCPNRPIEVQMSSMVKKLESALAENRDLKETLSKKIDKVVEENAALKAENRSLRASIDTERRALEVVKSNTAKLEARLTPTPPFYFTMDNLHHYMQDFAWKSPPFYSHLGGYKLRVTVYPNGTNHGYDTHVSLHVAVMRGEYDSQLPWPFAGNVTIEMYSIEKGMWGSRATIHPTPSSEGCRMRPRDDCISLSSWGIPKYIPQVLLHRGSGGYGIARFRVVCVSF